MADLQIPQKLVSSYYYVGADVALHTIVAPASNTKGVIVLSARAWANDVTGDRCRVMSKASAPTGVDDTAAATLAFAFNTNTSRAVMDLKAPVILPPGVGLYAQKAQANGFSGFACEYEVL